MAGYAPQHPQATTILVLGIVSIFASVVGPVAWYLGSQAQKEIEASGGRLGGLSQVSTGRIIGMVMTCILGAGLVVALAVVAILVLAVGSIS